VPFALRRLQERGQLQRLRRLRGRDARQVRLSPGPPLQRRKWKGRTGTEDDGGGRRKASGFSRLRNVLQLPHVSVTRPSSSRHIFARTDNGCILSRVLVNTMDHYSDRLFDGYRMMWVLIRLRNVTIVG
jgi:hypothetical protein